MIWSPAIMEAASVGDSAEDVKSAIAL
jgi:hypothetical protein